MTTDENGKYTFEDLAMGAYTVVLDSLPKDVVFVGRKQEAALTPSRDTLRVDFDGTYTELRTSEERRRPHAYYDVPYADTFAVRGGDGAYTWAVAEGDLPPGLALDAERGMIAGTPADWGTWTFWLEVTSGDGQSARSEHELRLMLHPTAKCSDYPDDAIPGFASIVLEVWVKQSLGIDLLEEADCTMLRTIESIDAYAGDIDDLAGVQNLTGLTSLSLARIPGVDDLTPLKDLTGLARLDLRGGALSDLTPLGGLANLEALHLEDDSITDLTPLAGLRRLRVLYLNHNEIEDVGPLAGLDGLIRLWIAYNDITDLTPLSALHALDRLDLDGNPIMDAQPLSSLMALEFLSFAYMPTPVDLTIFPRLPALAVLDLRSNRLSDIGPLGRIVNLRLLALAENPDVTDLQPLIDSPWLGEADDLVLEGTGADCDDVAALEAKGVVVHSDCEPS